MTSQYASRSYGYTDYANPRLESHMTFVCPECGVEFESQQDWRRHLNEEHDYIHKTPADFDFKEISESFHECQVCHKWVANANQAIALLQYHRFLHLPFNRTYRCRHCKGGFTRKRALCEHLYRFHSRQIIKVEKMRHVESDTNTNILQTVEQKALRDPQLNPEFYLRFLCPHCGKAIDRFEQWLRHLDMHQSTSNDLRMHRISGSRNHYCLQCRKLLYTNELPKLQRHRFTHLPFRLYFKCAFCMVKKSFKSEIFRHFVYAHPRHFNDAKQYIKKPIEWGAKINDRLNMELDTILRRYKGSVCIEDSGSVTEGKRGRPPKKQTYASEKARLAAQGKVIGQQYCAVTKRTNTHGTLRKYQEEFGGIDKITENDRKCDATLIDTGTEDDFEELCADVFESIEEETQSVTSGEIVGHEATFKLIKLRPDAIDNEEQLISIEINTVDENNDSSKHHDISLRTPPCKRLKLNGDSTSPISTTQQLSKNHNAGISSSVSHDSNKKALLAPNIHYLCPECGNEFDEQASWRTHVFSEHNIENAIQTNFQLLENQQSYLCLDCMDVQHTTKYSDLQRHRFMHMPFQAYLKCKLCSKTKSSKPKMLQHLQQHHFYNSCLGTELSTQTEHDTAQLYPCKVCYKYFTTKERRQLHRTQACGVRVNGMRASQTGDINSNIANNMRLLAHLKQAHARMERILRNDAF